MALVARLEPDIDYAETARLAAEGFGTASARFSAAHLAWLYGPAFWPGTEVMALYDADRKVGQVSLVRQVLRTGGREAQAVALMDLFILPAFRSREAIALLYGEAERRCMATGIDWLIAVPNGRAVKVNARLLKLEVVESLDIRAGLSPMIAFKPVSVSSSWTGLQRSDGLSLLHRHLPGEETGLAWTAERLADRLSSPTAAYGVHATDTLLLVSLARTRRRVPFTLLCGFFPRPGAVPTARDVRAVVAAACRHHAAPLFVYVGLNRSVPLPGLRVPERVRPSLMVVQMRDLTARSGPPPLSRFESIDFDFA